jgi:hypothetical protein
MAVMIWYLTSHQVLVHHRIQNIKKDDNNNRDNSDYDNISMYLLLSFDIA